MLFTSDRYFRFWDYNVSHDQLLLRSARSPDVQSNIDVVFWRVSYLEIMTELRGLALAEPNEAEIARVVRQIGKLTEWSEVYCIVSAERRFVVIAAGFKILENTLDIFESSLEYFAGTDPKRDLGKVLAHS